MAQYDPKVIRSFHRGSGCVRTYYSYDDELYAGTFPEEWAMDHAPGTGPKDCENCRDAGGWNGVFLGYCGNCAIYEYNGTRCKGFISPGVELHNSYNHDYDSAFDLYLYEVNLHDVGDTDIHDSMAETINRYADEFIHLNPRDVLAAFERMNDELYGNNESRDDDDLVDYFIDTNGTNSSTGANRLFANGEPLDGHVVPNVSEVNSSVLEYSAIFEQWYSGITAEQYYRDLGDEPACSMNTQESVPEPDQDMLLDETVHCMICENTKYNCACDE